MLSSTVTRTPTEAGISIDSIGFTVDCKQSFSAVEVNGEKPRYFEPYFMEVQVGLGTPTLNYETIKRDTVKVTPGDINEDGVINGLDLLDFGENLGKVGVDWTLTSDINKDGAVNGADLLLLQYFFGRTNSQNPNNYFWPNRH